MENALGCQNDGIIKEFEGLKSVAIQDKCKNLNFDYKMLEYKNDSFIIIIANNSLSVFVADENNKYVALKESPVK